MSKKLHYFLIFGSVAITMGEGDEAKGAEIPVNAIVRHDDKNFPAAKLAKAQQNLVKNMLTKVPTELHPSVNIADIIVQTVSYLGHMTEEEFQKPLETPSAPVATQDFIG